MRMESTRETLLRMRKKPDRSGNILTNMTLSQRFMLASLVILLLGMLGIGRWVEQQIVTGVIHRTGATTALYVDSFVTPRLQELAQSDSLLPENAEALRKLLQDTPLGQQIVTLKVWNTQGRLIFTTDASVPGKSYPMHEGMLRARLGEVVSEVSSLDEEENEALGALHDELLEIYSPVWLSGTDQIIAVAEFYQQTDDLEREIQVLKRESWLVVGLTILLIYLFLAGFVRRASDIITIQQAELGNKVTQLTRLLAQNRELNERVRRASGSVASLNESYLKRIGAELHDGPAQDLGLSLLKLDALAGKIEDQADSARYQAWIDQLHQIEGSLQNALKEVRGIATGLSLPQLAELSLAETVLRVVRIHERQTATQVVLEQDTDVQRADVAPGADVAHSEDGGQGELPLKITVYRLIQEALNNAYRHAGGAGQRVRVYDEDNQLVVEISDTGPGIQAAPAGALSGRLGLSGMRERVESLGGQFEIESHSGQGTKITARLPYRMGDKPQ